MVIFGVLKYVCICETLFCHLDIWPRRTDYDPIYCVKDLHLVPTIKFGSQIEIVVNVDFVITPKL